MGRNECLNTPRPCPLLSQRPCLPLPCSCSLALYLTTSNQIIVKTNICKNARCNCVWSTTRSDTIAIARARARDVIFNSQVIGRRENYDALDVDAYQDLHKNIKNIVHIWTSATYPHLTYPPTACIWLCAPSISSHFRASAFGIESELRKCIFIHFYCEQRTQCRRNLWSGRRDGEGGREGERCVFDNKIMCRAQNAHKSQK